MIDLNALINHLRQCPESFMKPSVFSGGATDTDALIKDVFRRVYGNFFVSDEILPRLPELKKLDQNMLLNIQIGCWFFSYDFFKNNNSLLPKVSQFLFAELSSINRYVYYRAWVEDEERAEEFVRLALWCCELLPHGETIEQATDRFDAISTLKRQGVLKETNESLQRIKAIRQKLAEEKAREASNPYGRE